jgi:hypothetical protein
MTGRTRRDDGNQGGKELEERMASAFADSPRLSPRLESELFARAEELLATRRERLADRERETERARQGRAQTAARMRELCDRLASYVALHPQRPATAAAIAALLLAFLALQPREAERRLRLTYADLPALPRFNDVPAKYDAQRLAERQAYEREVKNAHDAYEAYQATDSEL